MIFYKLNKIWSSKLHICRWFYYLSCGLFCLLVRFFKSLVDGCVTAAAPGSVDGYEFDLVVRPSTMQQWGCLFRLVLNMERTPHCRWSYGFRKVGPTWALTRIRIPNWLVGFTVEVVRSCFWLIVVRLPFASFCCGWLLVLLSWTGDS